MDSEGLPSFREVMGFSTTSDIFYEDDETDESIPSVQKVTKTNNTLPLWGNTTTMNLNPLVLENIVQSTYYKNYLAEVTLFQQAVDEILYNVKHLEPWERGTRKAQGMSGMCGGVRGVGAGGVISTAFCVMYKMFTMRLTRKQLVSMINSTQSVFMRGIGFIYIRYTQPPPDLWQWFEPYLTDDEMVDPRAGGGDEMTIGQFLRQLLTKLDWYGTLFPRIPVPIQKDLEIKFRDKSRNRLPNRRRERSQSPDRKRARSRSKERSIERRRVRSPLRTNQQQTSSSKHRKRCSHHLKHHHCRKHRHRCPTKAKKQRLENDKKSGETTKLHDKTSSERPLI